MLEAASLLHDTVPLMRIILRFLALRHGKLGRAWKVLAKPSALEWTEYMRRWGGLLHVGPETRLRPGVVITDPGRVWIGKNVVFAWSCAVIGHDGSATMLSRVYDEPFEKVGRVTIHDDVFVGYASTIMPGVTVGPLSIIAAGAVVTKDVPAGTIVGGVPAKPIGLVSDLVARHRSNG